MTVFDFKEKSNGMELGGIWEMDVDFATQRSLDDDDYDFIHNEYWQATESADYYGNRNFEHELDVTKFFIDDFPGYDDDEYREWINDAIDYFKGNSFELELLGNVLDD